MAFTGQDLAFIKKFPQLKEVEERYDGKNISFVSISVDDPDSRSEW